MVEEMIKERIAQLEAPAKAAKAAVVALQQQQESETRLAQKIAYAIEPQEPAAGPSTTMIVLILGGLAAAWWIMKGKKR